MLQHDDGDLGYISAQLQPKTTSRLLSRMSKGSTDEGVLALRDGEPKIATGQTMKVLDGWNTAEDEEEEEDITAVIVQQGRPPSTPSAPWHAAMRTLYSPSGSKHDLPLPVPGPPPPISPSPPAAQRTHSSPAHALAHAAAAETGVGAGLAASGGARRMVPMPMGQVVSANGANTGNPSFPSVDAAKHASLPYTSLSPDVSAKFPAARRKMSSSTSAHGRLRSPTEPIPPRLHAKHRRETHAGRLSMASRVGGKPKPGTDSSKSMEKGPDAGCRALRCMLERRLDSSASASASAHGAGNANGSPSAVEPEEEEWERRQKQTGAAGRLVVYELGDLPSQDFLLRGGGDKRRIMVASVTEGGKASMAGVKAGDVLVSLNGSKDFAGSTAEEVQANLVAPVMIVFMGFVGKLQAEVRLNYRQRTCGVAPHYEVFEGRPEAPIQVVDEHVFRPTSASLLLKTGSPTGSTAALIAAMANGWDGGRAGNCSEEAVVDVDDPDEEVYDIDGDQDVIDVDDLSSSPLVAPRFPYRELEAVYELRDHEARKIVTRALMSTAALEAKALARRGAGMQQLLPPKLSVKVPQKEEQSTEGCDADTWFSFGCSPAHACS